MNSQLQFQIDSYLANTSMPQTLNALLQAVSESYDNYENIIATGVHEKSQLIASHQNSERDHLKANGELTRIFNTMSEVFFSVDVANMQILQMSSGCEKLYGYNEQEFMADESLWVKVIHPDDIKSMNLYDPSFLLGDVALKEFRIYFKDGGIRWIECRMTPSLDENGRLIRIDGFSADITGRKDTEDALKAANEHLKKTNSELDRFVYSVSHDLRAPLASMIGAIQYAETETVEPVMLATLGLMKDSAHKLDVFIMDILDYSKNSRMDLMVDLVDFPALLRDISSNLKFMSAHNGKVEIRSFIEDGPDFYSDGSRLSIVLNNLVSNAIRYYSPKVENPYVRINVRSASHGVTIIVSDNGVGIDEKYHEKIFDMFYRVSSKSVGSGLGLYIVKETVAKLKGTLKFSSMSGKGTEFILFLPNILLN